LQGFEPKKITGKASGALRQEFRDLELLDEITKLQYLSKLPSSVYGDSRNTLIHTFRLHKGLTYVPKNVHPSIQWDKNDPMLEPILDVTLKQGAPEPISILTQDTLLKGPVKDTVPMNHTTPARGLKRKDMSPKKEHKQKKAKLHVKSNIADNPNTSSAHINTNTLEPCGTIWHQNSCAYDAILTVIHGIWNIDRAHYTTILKGMNDEISGNLIADFERHASGLKSLESARDDLRHRLHLLAPHEFTWGAFTSAVSVMQSILSTPSSTVQTSELCKNNHLDEGRTTNITCCLMSAMSSHIDIESWMLELTDDTNRTCPLCSEKIVMKQTIVYPLPLIALVIQDYNIQISCNFKVSISNQDTSYKLRGIIYYGDSHFTSRVIYDNGMVWFHDGITTGKTLIYDGMVQDLQESLNNCRGKIASMAIYARS
jgi:hypothetical protein